MITSTYMLMIANANYAWLLRSDNRVFQFFAMSEQEKRLWIDALQQAIQNSRELHDESTSIASTASTTSSTLVTNRSITPTLASSQQLAEYSLHNLPTQSSAPSSPTQSTANKVVRSSTSSSTKHHHHHHFPCSLFSRPHAQHTITPPPSPIKTVSPMRPCSTMPEISQDVSSSNSRHRSFSQASFRDILSSTMADIRAHRRCSHYYDHCAQMDKRFADVSYTSVLVARTQASSERNSLIEQRKKYKSRMAKSISMVALNTLLPAHPHCNRSRPQSPTTTTTTPTTTTPTLASFSSTASSLEIKDQEEREFVRRKSSLPDRLPSTQEDDELALSE